MSTTTIADYFCRCGHHNFDHLGQDCCASIHVEVKPFRHAVNGRMVEQRCPCRDKQIER